MATDDAYRGVRGGSGEVSARSDVLADCAPNLGRQRPIPLASKSRKLLGSRAFAAERYEPLWLIHEQRTYTSLRTCKVMTTTRSSTLPFELSWLVLMVKVPACAPSGAFVVLQQVRPRRMTP